MAKISYALFASSTRLAAVLICATMETQAVSTNDSVASHFATPSALSNYAAQPLIAGQITEGEARFTIITSECIRMEFVPKNSGLSFIDSPTYFAFDRNARFSGAKIIREKHLTIIDTGHLRLEYRPDGHSFNATNLVVSFPKSITDSMTAGRATWHPGLENPHNLGGPLKTLDGLSGPKPLSDGLLSKDGWSLIDDSGTPIFANDWMTQRRGGLSPLDKNRQTPITPCVDWYLFAYGDDYKGALASLKAISGPAAMPRKHVLGAWYCRWHPYTADEFRAIVAGFNEHDFPLDVLVMDMEWHTKDATTGWGHAKQLGWTGYTWNTKLIPDPVKLVADFKNDGIFVTLNDHPADGIRDNEECYSEFMKMLPEGTPANPPFNSGDPRYMQAFFKASHEPLEKQGIDFWWVDWQQDYLNQYVYGIPGLSQLPWLNYLYYRHSEENGRRGEGFSRWGGWGNQRYPIQFSGDAYSKWEALAFEIPFTLASGNAGCFFWAHDTGGFYGDHNPELFTRWVQFCSLSAALRLHSSGEDRRPWLWGQPFEEAMRAAFHLRTQLFPYIYTSVRQCYDDMMPLLRPIYLEYPDYDEAYAHPTEYFFGDNLLVAPIVSPGKGESFIAEETIWLPPGNWCNFFTGEIIEAGITGKSSVISAEINQIPIYVRAGVPLPMQPYTERMATSPLTNLVIRIYPDRDGVVGKSSLYEDDGQTSNYQRGGFARTQLSSIKTGNSVHIDIAAAVGQYEGQPPRRSYRIELFNTTKALSATVNGKRILPSFLVYEANQSKNIIEIPNVAIQEAQDLNILLSTADRASGKTR